VTILADHVRTGALQQIRRAVEARLHTAPDAADGPVTMSPAFLTQTFRIAADGRHSLVRPKRWSAIVVAGAQPALATVQETRERFVFSSLHLGTFPERVVQAMVMLEEAYAADPRRYCCQLVSLEGGVFSAVCLQSRRKPRPYVVIADRCLLDRDDLKIERNPRTFWSRARTAAARSAQKTNLLGGYPTSESGPGLDVPFGLRSSHGHHAQAHVHVTQCNRVNSQTSIMTRGYEHP
jgi:hypothetical protein